MKLTDEQITSALDRAVDASLHIEDKSERETAIRRQAVVEGAALVANLPRAAVIQKTKQVMEKYDAQLCILLVLIECLVLGVVLGWKVIITLVALIMILSVIYYVSEWR